MVNKEIVEKFRIEFFKELDTKPTWGREGVKQLFIITLNNVLLGNISEKTKK